MHSSLATPSAAAKQKQEQVFNVVFNMVHYNLSRIEKLPMSITIESTGPTSPATQGDTTIVTVQMLQTESTGIGQISSPLVDGTVGVTLPDNTGTSTDRYVAKSHGKQVVSEDLDDDSHLVEESFWSLLAAHNYTLPNNISAGWNVAKSYLPLKQVVSRPEGSACDDARSLVELTRSGFVGHPDEVRGELHVGINTQEEQNRTNDDGPITNLGGPAMVPQAPPSVNNAPAAVSVGDQTDAEPKRVSKMVIPVCGLNVATVTTLIMEKPSDAGDDATAAALYSVAMTFIALGVCVSVALVIYSILAKRTQMRGTRVLKSAMAMSLIFVFVAFITCGVFMLARPWLFFVGAVVTAMALYVVLIWKKDDDGDEGDRTRSGVV